MKRGSRILFVVVLGVLGVVFETQRPNPPHYRAQATILVDSQAFDHRWIPSVEGLSSEASLDLSTLVDTIPNTKLMRQVIKNHDLLNRPAFAGENASSASLDILARRLAARTSARTREGTRLIEISITDRDRNLAVDLVNWIAAGVIKQHAHRGLAGNQVALSVLTNEAKRLKLTLRNAEEALIEFRKTSKLVLPLEQKQALLEKTVADLYRQRAQLAVPMRQLERDLRRIHDWGDLATEDQLRSMPSLSYLKDVERLRTLLDEHEEDLLLAGEDLEKLPADYKDVSRALKGRFNRALKDAPFQLEAELSRLQSEHTSIQSAIMNAEDEILDLSVHGVEYDVLADDVEATKSLYTSVRQRIREIELAAGWAREVISIVQEAESAIHVSRPSAPLKWALIGCLLGIACVFVFNSLRPVVARSEA